MSAPLWICSTCHLIGSRDEALAHADETGHVVEGLSGAVSDAVREEWHRRQVVRVGELIAYSRFVRRAA